MKLLDPPASAPLCRLVGAVFYVMQKLCQLRADLPVVGSAGVEENPRDPVLQVKARHLLALRFEGVPVFSAAPEVEGHNHDQIRRGQLVEAHAFSRRQQGAVDQRLVEAAPFCQVSGIALLHFRIVKPVLIVHVVDVQAHRAQPRHRAELLFHLVWLAQMHLLAHDDGQGQLKRLLVFHDAGKEEAVQ